MPDPTRAYFVILMMGTIAYATRVAGFLLASILGDRPHLRSVLDVLPVCALAAVLAPAALEGGPIDLAALIVTGITYHFSSHVMLSLILGLTVLVGGAHLVA